MRYVSFVVAILVVGVSGLENVATEDAVVALQMKGHSGNTVRDLRSQPQSFTWVEPKCPKIIEIEAPTHKPAKTKALDTMKRPIQSVFTRLKSFFEKLFTEIWHLLSTFGLASKSSMSLSETAKDVQSSVFTQPSEDPSEVLSGGLERIAEVLVESSQQRRDNITQVQSHHAGSGPSLDPLAWLRQKDGSCIANEKCHGKCDPCDSTCATGSKEDDKEAVAFKECCPLATVPSRWSAEDWKLALCRVWHPPGEENVWLAHDWVALDYVVQTGKNGINAYTLGLANSVIKPAQWTYAAADYGWSTFITKQKTSKQIMRERWATIMEKDKTWFNYWYGDFDTLATLLTQSKAFVSTCSAVYGKKVDVCTKACEWSMWLIKTMVAFSKAEHTGAEAYGYWEFAEGVYDWVKSEVKDAAGDHSAIIPLIKTFTSTYWGNAHRVRAAQLQANKNAAPERPQLSNGAAKFECKAKSSEDEVTELEHVINPKDKESHE